MVEFMKQKGQALDKMSKLVDDLRRSQQEELNIENFIKDPQSTIQNIKEVNQKLNEL